MRTPLNRAAARVLACMLLAPVACVARGADPTESDYYRIVELPIPDDVFLEVAALEWMADGRLAVSSRRGDIYMVEGALAESPADGRFTRYAQGLHEALGLAERDGALYATQRGEVTRISDTSSDGRADLFETVSYGWEIDGDYHEYAWGSRFDANGDIWIVLCLTGSFDARNDFRGWCVRVSADGTMTPTASGIRSPGGIGFNAVGDVFYTDNQGDWNGTCGLKWLRPGSFQGNPSGNRYYALTSAIGPRPTNPRNRGRIMDEAKRIPEMEPTAVMFPFVKMGRSASGIACDTEGMFGPFATQLFVGDQAHSTVMRVFLEKVRGHYQGACFPFVEGFGSGSLALRFSPDGSALFVGGTNRGWGSTGRQEYALERLDWSGETPFEVHEMRAMPDGFELTFTHDIDPGAAGDLASYAMQTHTYIYRSGYGSPEVDHTTPALVAVRVGDDRRSVRLTVDGLREGHVHELRLDGVRSADGLPLLHPVAYYTLNYIP